MIKFKNKTIIAAFWNILERFFNQILRFIINIVLARLLFPSDYGMIGMLMIFYVIGQSFIEGGFINALIQKQNRTENDFSTVFYFCFFVSLSFYFIFFILSSYVSEFYGIEELEIIMKFLMLSIIIDSLSVVPRAKIAIVLDYKKQAKATLLALLITGTISIFLAKNGYGVWTLVIQNIFLAFFNTLFLYMYVKWKPKLRFSFKDFKDLFSYGSKLLIVNFFDRIIRNIYLMIIGKFYTSSQLGYYTRAEQFSQLPATNISGAIQNVTFPKMCKLSGRELENYYIRNIKFASFITFPIMLFLSFYSEPIVLLSLTKKWINVVPVLRLLSIAALIYPINFLNTNLLLSVRRTDLYLQSEFVKKTLIILILIFTVQYGIIAVVYGQIFNAILAIFINAYYTKKILNYSIKQQLFDIIPFFILSFLILIIVYFLTINISSYFLKILIGFIFTLITYIYILYTFNIKDIKREINFIFYKDEKK